MSLESTFYVFRTRSALCCGILRTTETVAERQDGSSTVWIRSTDEPYGWRDSFISSIVSSENIVND